MKSRRRKRRRRQRPVPTEIAIRRLREGVERLRDDVQSALATRAAFDVANDEVIAKYRGQQSDAAHTYNLISNSLALLMLLTVSRLHDVSARPIQLQNKASVPILAHLLTLKRVQARLVSDATWSRDGTAISREIAAFRSEYSQLRRSRAFRESLRRVRAMRDSRIAHHLIPEGKPLGKPPIFSDIYELLDRTLGLVQRASLIATGLNIEFCDFREEYERQARSFWSKALPGVFRDKSADS